MATMPWQNPAGLRCGSSAYRRSVRHLAQRMTARKRDLRRQHLAAAELIWPDGATKLYGERPLLCHARALSLPLLKRAVCVISAVPVCRRAGE